MLPDLFVEHLAHGGLPQGSREAETPMILALTGIAGAALGSQGAEHLTDLSTKNI